MSTLLWMISFLLHGISILAIYLLLKDKQNAGGNGQTESILKETLEEIREENRRLQGLLEESDQRREMPFNQKEERKQAPLVSAEKNTDSPVTEAHETADGNDYQTAVYQDEVETSLEAKILQLHANGETTDSIAKKLNCGKTEAEIIIKLHQKKSYK